MGEDGPGQLASQLAKMVKDAREQVCPALLAYHTHDSRKSPSGFPDWVILGPGGILFRELKRESKSPTPSQRAWLALLRGVGLDADVWRPSDLLSGRIGRELAAVTRPVNR